MPNDDFIKQTVDHLTIIDPWVDFKKSDELPDDLFEFYVNNETGKRVLKVNATIVSPEDVVITSNFKESV